MCDFLQLGGGEVTACSVWSYNPPSEWGSYSAEKFKDITYISWGAIRTHPQGCSIVSWLLIASLLILSLFWLTNIGVCLLGLREGHGGWMKPIFYKQETGNTGRLLCPGAPQYLAQFHSVFMLVPVGASGAHTFTHTHTGLLCLSHSQSFPSLCWNSHFSLLYKLFFCGTNASCLF